MTTQKERGNLAACLVELDNAHVSLCGAPDGAAFYAAEHVIAAVSLLAAEVRELASSKADAWDEGFRAGSNTYGMSPDNNPYRKNP